MKKLFTKKQYAEKALEANKLEKKLYILVITEEVEEEVIDYEEVEEEIQVPVYDIDGKQVIDDAGNPVYKTEIQVIKNPKYTQEEIKTKRTITNDMGVEEEIEEVTTVTTPITHIEIVKREVATLEIADDGYYICYEENYTDGTINKNYEKEKQEKQRKYLDSLTLTPSDVERALYKSLQMDFDDLKKLIQEKAPQIDIKAIGIELRANLFYRGATLINGIRLIDTVGALLGYTPDDMDYLFINKELPIKENN